MGKCFEVKKRYNKGSWRNPKVLVALLGNNSIMVVTERNNSNRKVNKHEHCSILPSFHR